jgi:hypothetical protein
MPDAEQREHLHRLKRYQQEALDALIGEQVIHILGEPSHLFQLQVRRLWENSYRVNVVVGQDAMSARIANSYFVKTDSDGNIIDSNPAITRRY